MKELICGRPKGISFRVFLFVLLWVGLSLTGFAQGFSYIFPGVTTNNDITIGNINLYDNFGRDWYNSLQLKVDKRFVKGFSYNVSYVFARDISNVGNDVTAQPTLYAPVNYDRGPSPLERRRSGQRRHAAIVEGQGSLGRAATGRHYADIHARRGDRGEMGLEIVGLELVAGRERP